MEFSYNAAQLVELCLLTQFQVAIESLFLIF